MAHRFHDGEFTGDPDASLLGEVAVSVLEGIGVTGPPLPPTTAASEFRLSQMGGAWNDGAIAPLTFRGLAMLLMDLPWQTRMLVATTMLESAWPHKDGENVDDALVSEEVAKKLRRLEAAGLDSHPNRPIIGVNLRAPRETVLRAVGRFVTEGKSRESIREVRRRPDKTPRYLAVWDLREGWVDDHYGDGREKRFREIAERLNISLATSMNRYRSAFRLISGHEYSFDNWYRLFASKVVGPHWSKCMARRHVIAPRRRSGGAKQTPESTMLNDRARVRALS